MQEQNLRRRRRERLFRMKHFNVRHEVSANKVGVDGVMVGAWASVPANPQARILDVGCGCGLIALMMAQRAPEALVTAIDIEAAAVGEAQLNAAESPWADRIEVIERDFSDIEGRFDAIVSNPPFFESGVSEIDSARMLARHVASLSPMVLIDEARRLLNPGGTLSLIAPAAHAYALTVHAPSAGLQLQRITYVRGNPDVAPKRVLLEFIYPPEGTDLSQMSAPEPQLLTIETTPNHYTPEYNHLHHDFYIKF